MELSVCFFSVSFVVFLLMFCLLVLPYYVVNKDEYIAATWNSETPEPIKLEFGTIVYVQHTTLHAKINSYRIRDIGGMG